MNKAAGVLVVNGDKILGFLRRSRRNPGHGLPCGKVEPGETWERTAIRETHEETGLWVRLLPDPFMYRDAKGRVRTMIFRAEISGGRLDAPSIQEGYPEWITPQQLLAGPYHDFSVKLLQYFGLLLPPSGGSNEVSGKEG